MAGLRDKVEEHVTCSICLERLENPKVLPCLHTFCSGCIMKLEKTAGGFITCPECRLQVKVSNKEQLTSIK